MLPVWTHKKQRAYDEWHANGDTQACEGEDCGATESHNHDSFREVDGALLCPACAVSYRGDSPQEGGRDE